MTDKPSLAEEIKYYFTEMEFYADRQTLGVEARKNWWTLAIYALASLGIFCRQITNFPTVSLNTANLNWGVFLASLIFGFAVLPYFIKQINAKHPEPGLQQVISAFGIGFFMDFTSNAIIHYYGKGIIH